MTSDEQNNSQGAGEAPDVATVVRDALVLQGKLVIDGLRDAILIPLSLLAALISLTQAGPNRGRFFYDIVRMGRRSEHWINLFAAADRVYPQHEDAGDGAALDDYLAQVEGRLAKEFRDGEASGSARRAVGALVDRIHSLRSSFRQSGDDDQQP